MLEDIVEYVTEVTEKISKSRGYNGNIGRDDNLLNVGIDSLDMMEIVLSVENKFHIKADYDKIGEIKTINGIVDLFKTAE